MDLSKQVITDNPQDIYYKIIVYTSKRSIYHVKTCWEPSDFNRESSSNDLTWEKSLFDRAVGKIFHSENRISIIDKLRHSLSIGQALPSFCKNPEYYFVYISNGLQYIMWYHWQDITAIPGY